MSIVKSFGGVYYGIYYIDSPICEIDGDSGYCITSRLLDSESERYK